MVVYLMKSQKNLISLPTKITHKIESRNFMVKNQNLTTGKNILNQLIINPLNLSKPVDLIDL